MSPAIDGKGHVRVLLASSRWSIRRTWGSLHSWGRNAHFTLVVPLGASLAYSSVSTEVRIVSASCMTALFAKLAILPSQPRLTSVSWRLRLLCRRTWPVRHPPWWRFPRDPRSGCRSRLHAAVTSWGALSVRPAAPEPHHIRSPAKVAGDGRDPQPLALRANIPDVPAFCIASRRCQGERTNASVALAPPR